MVSAVKEMLISKADKDYMRAVERRKKEERELREEMKRKMEEDEAKFEEDNNAEGSD